MLCHHHHHHDHPSAPKNPETVEIMAADDWFAGGRRVHFDPNHKKMAPHATSNTIQVFERVQGCCHNSDAAHHRVWLTLLPSFPDGSYGLAKLELAWRRQQQKQKQKQQQQQQQQYDVPRLYMEYVGQGDSEKPVEYSYNTMERADLVTAQWAAHGIQRTVVVACGYSSLVVLELLRRQQQQQQQQHACCRIQHVLFINGTVYADGPPPRKLLCMAPLLASRRIATLAQRSNLVLEWLLRPYTSSSSSSSFRRRRRRRRQRRVLLQQQQQKQQRNSTLELRETEKAIRRNKGTAVFASQAAATLSGQEHADWADRWDLSAIYWEYAVKAGITIDVAASPDDVTQLALVEERLGQQPGVSTIILPGLGGHLLAAAAVPTVCQRIHVLLERAVLSSKVVAFEDSSSSLPSSTTTPLEPWFLPPQVQYGLASSG